MSKEKKVVVQDREKKESDFVKYTKAFFESFTEKDKRQTKVYDDLQFVDMSKKLKHR